MHLTGNETLIRDIAKVAYPSYTGKKFRIETRETIDVRSCWDGGSRDYFTFVQVTGEGVVRGFEVGQQSAFDRPIHGAESVKLDTVPGLVCVRHSIFCGKDTGLTIFIHPSMMNPALLPAKVELTDTERKVLYYTRALKSSYGGISNYRQVNSGLTLEVWEATKADLVTKGLMARNGSLTVKGKNAAADLRY